MENNLSERAEEIIYVAMSSLSGSSHPDDFLKTVHGKITMAFELGIISADQSMGMRVQAESIAVARRLELRNAHNDKLISEGVAKG